MMTFNARRAGLAGVGILALTFALGTGPAHAQDKLIVAKSVGTAYTFLPIDVGERAGIWKKNGLALEVKVFNGAAQAMQALTAGTIEIGLNSGPSLAFIVKGVPAKGISAFGAEPLNMALAVSPASGITKVEDLKGKKIAVTTAGSLTDWMANETSRRQGWKGADAIQVVPLGATRTRLAAMRRGEVAGHVTTTEQSYQHEFDGSGKLILLFGTVVPDFITHVHFAHNDAIAKRPDVLRRFLKAWYETIAYMKSHRSETVDAAVAILKLDRSVLDRAYDPNVKMLDVDGRFDPKALKVLSRSFVDLKLLDKEPDMSALYTEQFLPARPMN
jgi:ABC-type nitrate/sulfonate/bicarbonate transport system substrate-binding protein